MKCEDVSKELIAYVDRRANPSERRRVEEHLADCAACRDRTEEMRRVSALLSELPMVEPSFGFDARVRQRVAAEPPRRWFGWFVPAPRLVFAVAMLIALSVVVAKAPSRHTTGPATTATADVQQEEDFNAIKNLGVLENYDVLTKFDALSEASTATPSSQTDGKAQRGEESND
jgi:anti-sigma factor RsiW